MKQRRLLLVVATVVVLGVAVTPGRGPGRVFGQETGSVAGWVYWGYCGYPYGTAEGGVQPGAPGGDAPNGPVIAYPVPSPFPAIGALVAIQGTDLATRTDEEGFFLIENVPLAVYYTVAASYPRRPRPLPQTESGRPPDEVRPSPVVCAPTSSWRGNVVVSDSVRPTNVGALMLPRLGPRPLSPDQSTLQAPEDDVEP